MEERRAVGEWSVRFWCTILKSGLSKSTVEIIAGRLQATSSTLKNMSVARSLRFFHNAWVESGGNVPMKELLMETYEKTGKKVTEGTPVWTPCCGCASGCACVGSL